MITGSEAAGAEYGAARGKKGGASTSGVGAGGNEMEEQGLPVLLLRELASFKARFPSRVGKHLRADAAELVLKTQVRGSWKDLREWEFTLGVVHMGTKYS